MWRPPKDLPIDGSTIIGLYDGNEVRVRYNSEREPPVWENADTSEEVEFPPAWKLEGE